MWRRSGIKTAALPVAWLADSLGKGSALTLAMIAKHILLKFGAAFLACAVSTGAWAQGHGPAEEVEAVA